MNAGMEVSIVFLHFLLFITHEDTVIQPINIG